LCGLLCLQGKCLPVDFEAKIASTLLKDKLHTHNPVLPACCLTATAPYTPGIAASDQSV